MKWTCYNEIKYCNLINMNNNNAIMQYPWLVKDQKCFGKIEN